MNNICPICGNPYISSKPTKAGGMEYIHQVQETFSEVCTQSAASYKAAQQGVQLTAAGVESDGENQDSGGN